MSDGEELNFNEDVSKTSRRKCRVINSDSEDEENSITLNNAYNPLSDNENYKKNEDSNEVHITRRHVTDTEEENNSENEQNDFNKSCKGKILTTAESDDDHTTNSNIGSSIEHREDSGIYSLKDANKQNITAVNNDTQDHYNSRIRALYDSDSSEDEKAAADLENDISKPINSFENYETKSNEHHNVPADNNSEDRYKACITALYDSDSSEEENGGFDSKRENEVSKKKIKKSTECNSAKPMTGKEAMEQRLEIQSDSQKRVRESQISLPYHKPKSVGIKEFLARRPRLASAIPANVANKSAAAAINMSAEQLELVSKQLEERERKIEEFYKSESDSDDEETNNETICTVSDEKITVVEISSKELENDGLLNGFECENHLKASISNVENDVTNQQFNSGVNENYKEKITCEQENPVGVDAIENIPALNDSKENKNQKVDTLEYATSENNVAGNKGYAADKKTEESIAMDIDNETTDEQRSPIAINEDKGIENKDIKSKVDKLKESDNMDFEYDFNLDDIEEESEESEDRRREKCIDQIISKFSNIDEEIEPPISNKSTLFQKNNSKLALQLNNFKPRLSTGGKQNVIVLDDDINDEEKKENDKITKLVERFIEHSSIKKANPKHKVELSVLSVDGNEVHKEKLSMEVHPDDEVEEIIEHIPGAGLKKLKADLQLQMARKRAEFWKQRMEGTKDGGKGDESADVYKGEKSECGATDLLDDEEEEDEYELSDSSEEENDEDLVENDVPMKDKPKTKSAFIEEEASESDLEEEPDEQVQNCTGNVQDDNDADDDDDGDEDNDVTNNSETEGPKTISTTKKPLKRIVAAFENDSDSDDEDKQIYETESMEKNVNGFMNPTTPVKQIDRRISEEDTIDFPSGNDLRTSINENNKNVEESGKNKNISLDSTDPWEDDDYLTPHQPRTDQTPCRALTQSKSDYLGLLTPNLRLTALQDFTMPKESPGVDLPFSLPPEPSPLKDQNWSTMLQKKLFADSEISNSQSQMSELAEMCSGNFCSSNVESEQTQRENYTCLPTTNSQDLLDICSGKFSGITQAFEASSKDDFGEQKDITTQFEDDPILSELLKEDEMGKFRKKLDDDFESVSSLEPKVHVTMKETLDTSDEDDEMEIRAKKNKKKSKQKKLQFSDDEDEESGTELDSECDEDAEDEVEAEPDVRKTEGNALDYDSEENEIEMIGDKEKVQVVRKASDFFENEAELSESEWGSADEDEKDLDNLEFELGDEENFDNKKLKNDLERIHMRRILDDDNREVKILQELLLDDGELHGEGRKRQFRWKNIDNPDDGEIQKEDDGGIYMEEEESEEQWRKMRHEREMFLKEQQNKNSQIRKDVDDDDNEGDLIEKLRVEKKIHIEHTTLKTSVPNSQRTITTNKTEATESDIKLPFTLVNKRGSFLARNDNVLTRLAEFTKVSTTVVGGAKNSRNFLFQSVEVKSTEMIALGEKKRKAASGTPQILKKLRLSDKLSPAVGKKNTKLSNSKVKKLFD